MLASIAALGENRIAGDWRNAFGDYTKRFPGDTILAKRRYARGPFSIVRRVLYDRNSARATGVEIVDAETKQSYEFSSRVVFLFASSFNSAWVLMNSATDVWPGGLGSSQRRARSQRDGSSHLQWRAAGASKGSMTGSYGRRPTSYYVPDIRNLFGDKRNYRRGFGYQGNASRGDWTRGIAELGIGASLKEHLTEPGPWTIG